MPDNHFDDESQLSRDASRLILLLPVYNDWDAVSLLLPALDRELAQNGLQARVLLVDDASTVDLPHQLVTAHLRAISCVEVLGLRRNLGHQRALAVGLAFIESNRPCDAVVVMDGDGEDDPHDVPRLIEEYRQSRGHRVVFAERTRRAESWSFRFFYQLYRLAHWLLTGIKVRAGNFSVLPRPLLERLVVSSELWNHYAASVHKIRLPFEMVPTRRAKRLTGSSRMNFISLATHGLSAISVFGDRVGVRMLATTITLGCLGILSLLSLFALHLGVGLSFPTWVAYAVCALLLVLLQMFMTSVLFVFINLGSRDSSSVVPLRDHLYYVGQCRVIYAAEQRVQLHR